MKFHSVSFLEPPKGPNDLCPRLNGFYAHPDPATCNIFYACVEGVAEEYTCSPGLWFDEYQGVCNWPSETDRKNCKPGISFIYLYKIRCSKFLQKC